MNYDEQIAALQAQIKELKAQRDGITPWMPEEDGRYYSIDLNSRVLGVVTFRNVVDSITRKQSDNLGIFKTEVEAENRIKQLRAITKWQSIPNDFVPHWGGDDEHKFYPIINPKSKESETDYCWSIQSFPFQHFASKEQCQRAIDWMGEESMRHLFGMFGEDV